MITAINNDEHLDLNSDCFWNVYINLEKNVSIFRQNLRFFSLVF